MTDAADIEDRIAERQPIDDALAARIAKEYGVQVPSDVRVVKIRNRTLEEFLGAPLGEHKGVWTGRQKRRALEVSRESLEPLANGTLTINEVAAVLGRSRNAVTHAAKVYGLRDKFVNGYDVLQKRSRDRYIAAANGKRTIRQIANLLDVSYNRACAVVRELDLPVVREAPEVGARGRNRYKRTDITLERYRPLCDGTRTAEEVAAELCCGKRAVNAFVKQHPDELQLKRMR